MKVCRKKKLVCGVGINDVDYAVQPTENGKTKVCIYYRTWKHMLVRCYSEKYHIERSTYKGCSVCEEWLTFSKYKSWMETQDYEGKQLDKDLLVQGNKVYSPETCVFVSRQINMFLVERGADRGEYPIGVCYVKKSRDMMSEQSKPYRAIIRVGSGTQKHLGYFSTPEEAHQAWLKAKIELAKGLAAEQTDPRIAKALISRYENYKEGK